MSADFAFVMSGSRSLGSSDGKGKKTISLFEFVSRITSEASSSIVIGFGFPIFIVASKV